MEILRIEGISKHFGGVVAVENFSMGQQDNQITGVIGPNGAGKTTVFNLITGATPVDQGRVLFMDREITRLPAHRRADLGIARTFQNIRLFRNLTVLDNMKVAHDMKVGYTIWEEMLRLPRVRKQEKAIDEKARHFLAYLALESFADQKPQNLPYGIQRRLELAKIGTRDPELAEKRGLVADMAEVAAECGMTLYSCCDAALLGGVVRKASCVDGELLAELFPDRPLVRERRPTREGCGCYASRDIGMYDTCTHGCEYCYANQNQGKVMARWERHDSEAEMLVSAESAETPFLCRRGQPGTMSSVGKLICLARAGSADS